MKLSLLRFYACAGILAFVFMMAACQHQKKQAGATKKPIVSSEPQKITRNGNESVKGQAKKAIDFQQKIGIKEQDIDKNKLYAFINEWYGTPYKYGGCQKSGVDCSCFANLLYEQVYGKKIARSAAEIFKSCDEIGLEDVREGDMVFFKIGGKSISHVGVYIRKNYFIHSSTSEGVVLNSIEEAYYKKYFFCAGKMKKV